LDLVAQTLHPIIIEDVFTRPDADLYTRRGLHVIVLVHGFQGNVYDVKLIKHMLSEVLPEVLIMGSSTNENFTEG
jgi:hypothetical protein